MLHEIENNQDTQLFLKQNGKNRFPKGMIPHNKLSHSVVQELREYCKTHKRTECADKFGISYGTVWQYTKDINTRKTRDSQFPIEGEKWKDVVGYEGYYMVSDFGRVKTLHNNRIMGSGVRNWYPSITLCKNGTRKSVHFHRLVAIAFIPNPENKPCVNHVDGNKRNNHVLNLEWCTQRENEIHSFRKLGKKSNIKTLKNYSKDWEKPLMVGSVKLCGKPQKLLYRLLKDGVKSNAYKKYGLDSHWVFDTVRKLRGGGVKISNKKVTHFDKELGRNVRCTLYKLESQ